MQPDSTLCILLLVALPNTLWAVKIQCNHPERIREDHIHYCCKHPDGHNDITEACAKKTNFKLPAPSEEALEDVTVEQVVASTCWGVCVFNKFEFLHNNSLDMGAVRRHYHDMHANDREYQKEMVSAFDHCHGKSEEATAAFMSKPILRSMYRGKFCDPTPSVIMSCVIHYFFHNCPTDRWAHTQECKDALAFSKKCKDALTIM